MSNTEKRSVHTDALETLGNVIGGGEKRDAIHVAVEPVEADCVLYPGQHVGRLDNGLYSNVPATKIGIVDPFINGPIFPGQHFWLLIYPRQITSLRHVWAHPAFDSEQEEASPAQESKNWLDNYAKSLDVTYDGLIRHANNYLEDGDYWVEGGRFEGECVPEEFWDHYESVTGKKVENRGSFFSCSC